MLFSPLFPCSAWCIQPWLAAGSTDVSSKKTTGRRGSATAIFCQRAAAARGLRSGGVEMKRAFWTPMAAAGSGERAAAQSPQPVRGAGWICSICGVIPVQRRGQEPVSAPESWGCREKLGAVGREGSTEGLAQGVGGGGGLGSDPRHGMVPMQRSRGRAQMTEVAGAAQEQG